jgi:hypothetical protein
MDPAEEFVLVLEQAESLPYGPTKVALMEQAVSLADAMQDDQLAYETRMQLTQAAQFSGRPDLSIVTFSRCLAHYDKNPEKLEYYSVLWQYKWVVNGLAAFPDVPRSQIEELFADMTRRFQEYGSTMHAIHQIRRDIAEVMCDKAIAKEHDAKFRKLRRDDLSNCKACVPDANITYMLFLGDDEAAINEAKPILSGKMTCAEVPHRTYSKLIMPYLRLGEVEKAMKYHKLGYPMIQDNPSFLEYFGTHMAFLALTGNFNRMTTLFNRHIALSLTHPDLCERFRFFNFTKLALDVATEAGKNLTLKVPKEISQEGSMDSIAIWIDNELYTLADRFDKRNGNDGFHQAIRKMQKDKKYAERFPFKASE